MAQFRYKPLSGSGRSIRILTLNPNSWDTLIECDIRDVSLDDIVPYEALSYTWGDNTTPRRILLNGLEHHITPNLESALRHLRCDDRPRALWMDQLCINQDDPLERAAQVILMAEIYKRATITVSWLGEASEDSDEAMDLIRNFGNWVYENDYAVVEGDHENLPDDASIETPTDLIEWLGFPLRNQNWPALRKLFERPYWSRIWIVQELAVRGPLLRTPGVIRCGTKEVQRFQYDGVCSMIIYIVQHGPMYSASLQEVDEPFRSMCENGHTAGLTMAQTIAGCTSADPAKRSLSWLVTISMRFQATDPRDKVFALLGLASDGAQSFKPNYTKTFGEVLQDFVKFDVQYHKSLRSLLFPRFRIHTDESSWTPDFFGEQRGEGNRFHPLCIEHINAAGSTEPDVVLDDDPRLLKVSGILIGRIDRIIGPLRMIESRPDQTNIASLGTLGHREVFEALRDFDTTLLTPADRDSFWRTLCMDGNWFAMDPELPAPKEFEHQKSVLLGERLTPQDISLGSPNGMRASDFSLPFLRSLEKSMGNRTFFTTSEGRMGLGPYHACAGDVVAVLFGCAFCIVLRPCGRQYKLVGPAYVHGVMHGELIHGPGAAQNEDVRVFELR